LRVSTASRLRTPLYDTHRRLGGRLVDFAGWEMPVQYPSGIIAEHLAVRSTCGVFDLSHMGRLFLRGADALTLAQLCVTRNLSRLANGEAAYTVLCLPDGGILDDVIVYLLGLDELLFVVNASNRETDLNWLLEHRDRRGLHVTLNDQTLDTALIGIQGPTAQALLQPHCPADLDKLPGYSFLAADVVGRPALVARTGYTGEDGFEVMVEAEHAERVWNALLEAGAQPAGLGARDTLRTEAAMALYGNELDTRTNPYEARLGWVVSLSKPDFIGREALTELKARGPARRLVGLTVAAGGVPRHGFAVLDDGQRIGHVTSGTFAPSLRRNVALAYVPTERANVGQAVGVEMRGKAVAAEVATLPFVPNHTRPRAGATR
jgi:aminomethyltransferase